MSVIGNGIDYSMMTSPLFGGIIIGILLISITVSGFSFFDAKAQMVPDWIKNTAKWYGEEKISEADFLNAIKFLIENKIIVLDTVIAVEGGTLVKEDVPHTTTSHVVIPNGNSDVANTASYIPLNLEIKKGTTVIWINDDVVKHTVQSQDGHGKIVSLFNSDVLDSGNRFAHKFEESGVYNYYCTIHPWRVGLVTVR